MVDINNPTEYQAQYVLGEIGSNAYSRRESGVCETAIAIGQAVALGSDPEKVKVPTAVSDRVLGVAIAYKENAGTLPNSSYVYQINDGIVYLRQGDITVAPFVVVSKGDAAYVETAAGANRGYFTNVASATTIPVGSFEETTTTAGQLARMLVNCI